MDARNEAELTLRIARLFPDEVAVHASQHLPGAAALLPEEAAGTGDMVAGRLREFTLGRYCARAAIATLGWPASPIPRAADRSPIWPRGIVGSISHSGQLAAAAVAAADRYAGLGLDIESSDPLTADLARMICRDNESREGHSAKLLFGIKEAIYKCIYPTVGIYVDFQDMEVRLNADNESFTAVSHSTAFAADTISALRGCYLRDAELLICGAWLPA